MQDDEPCQWKKTPTRADSPAAMKHPFQILIADSKGEYLFTSVKNHLIVYRIADGSQVGWWSDDVDSQSLHEQKFIKRREEQKKREEEEAKLRGEPEPKKPKKEPKIPVPGPGAPKIYNYIRSLTLTRNEKYIIGTTDSDKAAVVFELDFKRSNCIKLVKRQVFPKRPCAVLTSLQDTSIVLGDKFGDVYEMPIDDSAAVEEKDLVPILGHVSMLSDVLVAEHEGRQYILTGDRDEHIKVTCYPESYVVKHWLFGHREFVSILHICSFDKDLLISGGGDDYLLLWKWWSNTRVGRIDLRPAMEPHLSEAHFPPDRFRDEDSVKELCISKVATFSRDGVNFILVLCENTRCILAFTLDSQFSASLKQTILADNCIVDFALAGDHIIVSLDVESDNHLLDLYMLGQNLLFEKQDTAVGDVMTGHNFSQVSQRSEFYPLYHINSLRKRSEH